MAALQPIVGGLPLPPFSDRSFTDVLRSKPSTTVLSSSAPLHVTSIGNTPDSSMVGTHKGFPAIYINDSRWSSLAEPFQWTLVGKFSHGFNRRHPENGRPPVDRLQKYFEALDLKSEFSIGLLDNRHLLIQLRSDEDYLRLYSRVVWNIGKVTMRTFKWTPDFHVEKESSLVPVWINLPRLPIHLFSKPILFEICSLVGLPLRMDAATAALKRPSMARLQVEIDLLHSRPSQIWIGIGGQGGFWQRIEYEHVPSYCQKCWHVGHDEKSCRLANSDLVVSGQQADKITKEWRLKEAPALKPKLVDNPKFGKDPLRVTFQALESALGQEREVPSNNGNVSTTSVPKHDAPQVNEVVSEPETEPLLPNTVPGDSSAGAALSIVSAKGTGPTSVGEVTGSVQGTLRSTEATDEATIRSSDGITQPILGTAIDRSTEEKTARLPLLAPTVDYLQEQLPLPVIFCGDASDSEDVGEIIVGCSTKQPHTAKHFIPHSVPSAWSPGVGFPKPRIFCGDDTPQSAQDFSELSILSPDQSAHEASGQRLNVDATPWHPQDRDKTVIAAPFQSGRTLPQSFNPSCIFDVLDADSNSWRTVDSAEEDAEEEDSGREDSMEEFLDSQYIRDDLYLEERRKRQSRHERDTVLMRRGRGRPLGSRNRTFFDAEHPMTSRQSGRSNKGVPPKHYEPGL